MAADPWIGRQLGVYKILNLIGRGGMGEVYRAIHVELEREAAIKFLRSDQAGDPRLDERFKREARAIARLRHDHIVQLYDFDVYERGYYMVLEFVKGETLRERLQRLHNADARLPHTQVKLIIDQLTSALAHSHSRGVIHRDIKPANIMLDGDDNAILADFGIAHVLAETGHTLTEAIGTPAYMAPEQIRKGPIDHRADLYSLGVVLYEMLTGRLPFTGDNVGALLYQHQYEPVPDPMQFAPDLPRAVALVVQKALVKLPEFRYQSAIEFQQAFRQAWTSESPASRLDVTPVVLPASVSAMPPGLSIGESEQIRPTDGKQGMGIPPALCRRLREVLLRCGPFSSDEALRHIFTDQRIYLWRYKLPRAEDSEDRVGRVIDVLHDLYNTSQENALALLVCVLRDLKDPGDACHLQLAELAADVGKCLCRTPAARSTAPFPTVVDIPHFIDREKELAAFESTLIHHQGLHIYCLTGMGGIGKTTLAIHIAYTMRDYFPDGVLWANVTKSKPLAILDEWATAYGFDLHGYSELSERAAEFRSKLFDKKVLVILDDVQNHDQIRDLLPNGPQCMVLITTRNAELAASLATAPGANDPLDALPPEKSRELLAHLVEDQRILTESEAADEICQILGHLPLALEIAARRLASPSRRHWGLAHFAERLRDKKRRLQELKIGDKEVRASFAVSWDSLTTSLRESFAQLAVFEGRTFTAQAFAAIAELDDEWAAEDTLGTLVDLSLLSQKGEEGHVRYWQHPLLADFARESLEQAEAVYTRMITYYLEYTRVHQRDYAELEREWNNLSSGIHVAYAQALWKAVLDYADVLTDIWFTRGYFSDARQSYAWACEAARRLADCAMLATCLQRWGQACLEQKDYAEAEAHFTESLQVYRSLADLQGIASTQCYLARIAFEHESDYDKAEQLLLDSRRIWQKLDDTIGVSETLFAEARINRLRCEFDKAKDIAEQALVMQQLAGEERAAIRTLNLLASIAIDQGALDLAERHSRRAMILCEKYQDRNEMPETLGLLADVYYRQKHFELAQAYAEDGLELLEVIGDRGEKAILLYQLSMIYEGKAEYPLAMDIANQSLALCQELDLTFLEACVRLHIGDLYLGLGQHDEACTEWNTVLTLAQALQHSQLQQAVQCRLDQNSS